MQQSQVAETLECTREHPHSKVLVPHDNHLFGRHFGFVFEEDSGRSPDRHDVIVFKKLYFEIDFSAY